MGSMRLRLFVFLLLALSIIGGCGDNDTSTVPTAATDPTATTPADTDATATPSTPPPAEQIIVLRHDGLGVVTFGQPADTVIEVLSGLFGPPDFEEIQISPDVDRSVQWEEPFLYLQFTSWDHFSGSGPDPVPQGPIFHYYLTTAARYTTDAGISQGSTVAQLKAAYPGVVFHQACGGPAQEFLVEPVGGWPRLPLFGLLDGDAENPETRIVHIGAGWDRNPC